ncbi:MAG: ABC transporter substrate-binding protein [Syntrophorhabdales bacterium]|jgi:branched-chain amino acid transport system substrate-binding protein
MRKQVCGVVVVLMCAVSLFWASPAKSAEPAPYVIGMALDLTGVVGSIGTAEKRGFDYMLDKVNAAGGVNGRKLKPIVYDSQCIAVNDVKNAKRLIEVDKVTILSGFTNIQGVFGVFPLVAEAKIPFIMGTPVLATGAPPPNPWVFTVVPDQAMGSTPILVNNLADRGCTKIAFIYVDFIFGQTGLKWFQDTMQKRGLKPAAIEKYAMNAIEMDSQVARIKASGADGIIITGGPADVIQVVKTAHNLGFTGKIAAEYAVVSPEFLKLGGKEIEGLVSSSLRAIAAPDLAPNDPQKKIAMEMYNFYTKKYGDMSLYAAHAWDMTAIIVEGLKKVDPKLDPSKPEDVVKIRAQFRDGVEQIKGLVGQNGIFNFSPTDHIGLKLGCYVPVVVKDGEWKLYR